jgi:hypothetical protein
MSLIVPLIAEIEIVIATAAEPDAASLACAFAAAKSNACDDRWDLLIQVFQMVLRARNLAEPFGPISVFGDKRSLIATDFTTNELAGLRSVFPGPDHPGYRARLGDVLWLRERDTQAGELAADAYRKLGEFLLASPYLHEAGEHFERGVRLAMQINRRGQQVLLHLNFIVAQAMAVDPTTTGRLPTDLLNLLYDLRYGDAEQLAERSLCVGSAKRKLAHYPAARAAYDLAAKFFHRAQDPFNAELARISSAETHAEETNGFADGLGAHSCIRSAILAYQKIPSCRDRIPPLQRRLRAVGKSVLDSMTTSEFKEDLTPLIEETKRAISGATFAEAIFRLAFIEPLLNEDELRVQVEEEFTDSPLSGIFNSTELDSDGRTVAVAPGVLGSEATDADLGIQYHIHRQAAYLRNYICAARIGPALGVINLEHIVDTGDIEPLLQDHPLIAEGHTLYFARGIADGLRGDFASALHLLVPQIENSLRIILHAQDVITTDLTKVGIEHEWALGRVLAQSKLKSVLGEPFVFELKALMLADPAGSNIRNRLAHGLLPFRSTRSVGCVYLWWIILRLVLRTSPQYDELAKRHREPSNAATNTA